MKIEPALCWDLQSRCPLVVFLLMASWSGRPSVPPIRGSTQMPSNPQAVRDGLNPSDIRLRAGVSGTGELSSVRDGVCAVHPINSGVWRTRTPGVSDSASLSLRNRPPSVPCFGATAGPPAFHRTVGVYRTHGFRLFRRRHTPAPRPEKTHFPFGQVRFSRDRRG